MKLKAFALLVPLSLATPIFADSISISIPSGGDLVQSQAPSSAPVRMLRRDELKGHQKDVENCITTLVMVDGKKGQPLRICPPTAESSDGPNKAEVQDPLSPFNPEFDLSGMDFH